MTEHETHGRANAQLQARIERLEADLERKNAEVNRAVVNAKRAELVSLGYPAEKAAKKNDLVALDALIEEWRENQKNLDDQGEDEEDETETKKKKKGDAKKPAFGTVRGNAAPAIPMPDGSIAYAGEIPDDASGEQVPDMHLVDPMQIPRSIPRFNDTCYPIPLGPTADKPYNRLVA